jgi:dihydrofolate reductase
MPFSLIAAVAANRVIGNGGKLPWRLPDDMARFRRLTMGHAVVMGRATFASLGKPLPGRRNIVLTRDAGLNLPGCEMVNSLEQAMAAAGNGETFVIGGAAVYEQFLPRADRMYLTLIHAEVPGDTLFPEVSWDEWRIVAESAAIGEAPGAAGGGHSALPHTFVDYERLRP